MTSCGGCCCWGDQQCQPGDAAAGLGPHAMLCWSANPCVPAVVCGTAGKALHTTVLLRGGTTAGTAAAAAAGHGRSLLQWWPGSGAQAQAQAQSQSLGGFSQSQAQAQGVSCMHSRRTSLEHCLGPIVTGCHATHLSTKVPPTHSLEAVLWQRLSEPPARGPHGLELTGLVCAVCVVQHKQGRVALAGSAGRRRKHSHKVVALVSALSGRVGGCPWSHAPCKADGTKLPVWFPCC